MGTFDQALARSALDQQRSIVLQEKGEREPFSRAMMRMSALAFAPEHPYRRSVIGEDADLIATTLDDARRWYKRFYGPSNAVLTIRDTTIKSLRQARSYPSVLRPVQMEQLFGRGHPLTWAQTGTVASVASLGMEDVAASHRALWDPSQTTVFCAGGLSLDRLVAVLERNAGSWPRCRDRLMYPIAVPPPQPSPNSLAILEDAGRAVCSVKAARLLTADASSDLAGLALSHAVGGTMNSRLMHRLREERGWAYGGGSDILSLGRPDIEQVLSIHTGVPTQHAAATVSDIMALVDAAAGAEPISLQERNLFVAARERHVYQALRDPGRIVASMQRQLSANRQLGGWAAEFEALGALTVESIRSAAESMFSSSGFSWTITGDVASIENQFASSGPRDVELFRWDITKDGD
jgi:predicted Zn-dependent peptidase